MKANLRAGAVLAAIVALVVSAGAARAVTLTDGSLVLDLTNDGHFQIVSLNGTGIDTSGVVQQYFLMGGTTFTGASPVIVSGSTATYTAMVGFFDVHVSSSILGPLASNPATTNVLQQVLTFTNIGGGPVTLAASSFMDQDLKTTSGGDTVAFDAARQAVYAVDSPILMAAIAKTDVAGATFGWDVDILGACDRWFPLSGGVGPVGPADTAMAIGYNVHQIPLGGSATIAYRYLFSTNLSAVPPDFSFTSGVIPEPVTMLGLLAGLSGLVGYVRRRAA